MKVLELVELKKALEEEFGVSAAAAPMMMAGAVPAAGDEAAAEEEQTEFDVILKDCGAKKIQVIKVVRQLTGLGLKEAKELVDGAPNTIKEAAPKEEAEDIIKQIEEVGGTAEMK
ncbi:MAG TPA: 50S ribosomal protein L7/L12 [Bacteroidetes bacterium]|nr:50S ribosomal protein L7/L12 [Bacteroidota bacterium]HEX05247.1 50S ribosomal protein L7/L12 [Bacteroidota bacterium]